MEEEKEGAMENGVSAFKTPSKENPNGDALSPPKSLRSISNSDEEDLQLVSNFFTIKNNEVFVHNFSKGTS